MPGGGRVIFVCDDVICGPLGSYSETGLLKVLWSYALGRRSVPESEWYLGGGGALGCGSSRGMSGEGARSRGVKRPRANSARESSEGSLHRLG